MRALEPDTEGYVDRDGVKLHYEVFGQGAPTLLLLPTWTVVHARFWNAQVPYLARHFQVVTYDGPGNGRSDRPEVPAPYRYEVQGRSVLAVLDATGTDRAVLAALSEGAQWALWAAAHHPERVLGSVFIGPTVDLDLGREAWSQPFDEPYASTEGWARYNRHDWLEHWEEFLEFFFFSQCFTEPHSTKQDEATLRGWCARVRRPVLVIHGDKDEISPRRCGEALARATGGRLVVLEGAGHLPQARDPVKVNRLIREFAGSHQGRGPA
jgi:pimeloyl-ACP methyl ester carboxylesterase